MQNNRVLVTGGTGFIGSALVERLVKEGLKPVVFDNDSRGSKDRLGHLGDAIEIMEGDIRKGEDVDRATEGCSAIFHLAFVNGTRFFYEKPELVLEVGVKGALTTLEAALKHKVDKYVLASSSEVYQQPTRVPTPEDERMLVPDPTNPRYSYAGGKIISELLALNYLRGSGVTHTIFRPHNVVGPRMGFEHVIPELMKKLHIATDGFTKDSCKLEIQGAGTETRAFCYVEDAVEQVIAVYNNGESGEIYHVGMDHERSILELIEDMGKALGVSIEVVPGELRAGGTSRRCPDISKVKALGYERNDRYFEGLEKTVAWYKDHYLNA